MKHILPHNLPILEALSLFFPKSSKNTLRSWIKEGRVQLDNVSVKTTQQVAQEGQTLTIGNRKKFLGNDLTVIYEDGDIVAVDKPIGLLSVASTFQKEETAHAFLKIYYKSRKIFVIHRLDQDTSGVLLFAFNQKTYEELKSLFAAHDIERSYTAIVEGHMQSPKGTWKNYLYEDPNYRVHLTDDPTKGEEAITHYKTIATSKKYSLLELTLETGKKNQIRVHCQAAGHPIVGDKKYGAHSNPIKRLALHAHLLAFKHPISHKKLRLESPVPEDFFKLISPSGKAHGPHRPKKQDKRREATGSHLST